MVLVVKNSPANCKRHKRPGFDPGLGRSPGGGLATHCSILDWRLHTWSEMKTCFCASFLYCHSVCVICNFHLSMLSSWTVETLFG